MGFEVRPTGLGSTRWYARIAAAIGLCALVIGIGLVARLATAAPDGNAVPTPAPSVAADASVRPSRSARPSASATRTTKPAPASSQIGTVARPLPRNLDCHGLAQADCKRVATAALGVLTSELPAVAAADVYNSLICDSTFDCPKDRLTADALPLGSVTVEFVDGGPSAWINVVQHGPSTSTGVAPAEAWLIRWR